jgi:hypothetical protein
MRAPTEAQMAMTRNERIAFKASELSRELLAVFRPALLTLIADAPRPVEVTAPPPPVTSGPTSRRTNFAPDPVRYLFVDPKGRELIATRSELHQIAPYLNSGSLSDLVHGVVRSTKGFRCLGPAPADDNG